MFDHIFGSKTRTDSPNTGLSVPPNTFAHETLDALEADGFDDLAVRLPVLAHADINLGGGPFAAAQLARTSRSAWREEEADHYVGLESALHAATLGGTGYLAHRFAGVPRKVDTTVDVLEVLVCSDDVAFDRKAQTTVAQALAYPFIENGTVLLSNRVRESSEARVASDVGHLLATVAREDIADFQHYCFTGQYRRIEVAGNRRTKTDFARILGQVARDDPWFDPADWMWWTPDDDPGPALGDDHEVKVIAVVPRGYEDVNLDGHGSVHAVPADVEDIHVVVLKTLNREWVDELRVGGVRWLRREIRTGGNKFAALWESFAKQRGLRDPLAAFDEFVRSHYHGEAEEAVASALDDTTGGEPLDDQVGDGLNVAAQNGPDADTPGQTRADGGYEPDEDGEA